MTTDTGGRDALASLVEEIEALAEHTRLHGPASDCSVRMDGLIERHRARIAAARTVEREAPEVSDADR